MLSKKVFKVELGTLCWSHIGTTLKVTDMSTNWSYAYCGKYENVWDVFCSGGGVFKREKMLDVSNNLVEGLDNAENYTVTAQPFAGHVVQTGRFRHVGGQEGDSEAVDTIVYRQTCDGIQADMFSDDVLVGEIKQMDRINFFYRPLLMGLVDPKHLWQVKCDSLHKYQGLMVAELTVEPHKSY